MLMKGVPVGRIVYTFGATNGVPDGDTTSEDALYAIVLSRPGISRRSSKSPSRSAWRESTSRFGGRVNARVSQLPWSESGYVSRVSAPILVVDVKCESRVWSYEAIYVSFDEADERVTSVTTVNIDAYGDRHEFVDSKARLHAGRGTHLVTFADAGMLLDSTWERRSDGWKQLPYETGKELLSQLEQVSPAIHVDWRALERYEDLPTGLEVEEGTLFATGKTGKTGKSERIALFATADHASFGAAWERRATLFVVTRGAVVGIGAYDKAPSAYWLLPHGGTSFQPVVDPRDTVCLERAMNRFANKTWTTF